MNPRDFERLIGFIRKETGIELPETNYKSLILFTDKRMGELHCTLDRYIGRLKHDDREYEDFLDEVTINETYFFREERHFKLLESVIFPDVSRNSTGSINLWSAACSTGEEALSLAALAKKKFGGRKDRQFCVYATDINPAALKRFRKGEFRKNSFREDGKTFHALLEPFLTERGQVKQLRGGLNEYLHIFEMNLYTDDYKRIPDGLDLIFLRNTLIYMSFETRKMIISALVKKLSEGGCMFLSSSEMPLISHPDLLLAEHDGIYYFRKKTVEQKREGTQFDMHLLEEIERHEKELPEPADTAVTAAAGFSADIVCEYANQKINNPLFTLENDLNYTAAIYFVRGVVQINSNELDEALRQLGELSEKIPANEITDYLLGFIEMVRQNNAAAADYFRRALQSRMGFWPARFYLGLLYRNTGDRRARQELELCSRYIDRYIREDNYMYQFLLEGFNAKYFQQMCIKLMEKLER